MSPERGRKLSVTERIYAAKQYLGVSRREISSELSRFAEVGDVQGLQGMFQAYLDWELRESKEQTPDQIRTRAWIILMSLQI